MSIWLCTVGLLKWSDRSGHRVEAVKCRNEVSDDNRVSLVDGQKVWLPLIWYPCLAAADEKQRAKWELLGDGQGIHWPDIDEDLSVSGILKGAHYD